ncbi:hypothetical protein ACL03H_07510 [Saccharopolyspora sp. MS10]
MRPIVADVVGPVVGPVVGDVVREQLGADNTDQADAMVERIAARLSGAAA